MRRGLPRLLVESGAVVSFLKAMGNRDGDSIQLTNAWARVTITRINERPDPVEYELTGDVQGGRARVKTLTEAVSLALLNLADYERGRGD